MSKATYHVHLELTAKGNFTVTVPKLPGCRVTAATFEQALEAAKSAIEDHLKMLNTAGKAIPVESSTARPLCFHLAVEAPKRKRKRSRP